MIISVCSTCAPSVHDCRLRPPPYTGSTHHSDADGLMKLSARDVLPERIVSVTKGSTTAHVKIERAAGLSVTASITNEAVDDLGLKVGDDVSAVIKSSDVMIGK
jgi:molybdopterin-binding protein